MKLEFEKTFASHSKSIYWSNENILEPIEVLLKSGKLFSFDCNICHHTFKMKPIDITSRNSWCPYCSVNRLCDNINCNTCFNKSFASYWRSWWLLDENDIDSRNIHKYSNKNFKFKCTECNHIFITSPNKVSIGNWCKYCANQELCNNQDCTYCFKKSFKSHIKYNMWSDDNIIDARYVSKSSHTKYIFKCAVCTHSFECSPANITRDRNCSYCTNKKLCQSEDCNICYNKSFASCEKSKYWSKQNSIIPRYVFKCSNKKYEFNCNYCNLKFVITPNNVVNNRWCSKCRNKTEKKLYEILKELYNTIFHPQYEWCKNSKTNRYLPFDFECDDNIIIELDGLQHFKQVRNWKSPDEQKIIDKYKMDCALNNNKHIIRIYQEDVYYDRNNWKETLINIINELKNSSNPTIKYINIDSSYFD
jgi:hypothetical protein